MTLNKQIELYANKRRRWSLHYKLHCTDFMFWGEGIWFHIVIYIINIYINNIYDVIIVNLSIFTSCNV